MWHKLTAIFLWQNKVRPSWWQPWTNTIAYYKLESDLNDYSGNEHNLTPASNVTFSTLASGKGVCFFDNSASVSSFPAFTWDITFSFYVRNSSNYTGYNNIWYIVKANSTTSWWDEANSTAVLFSWESQSNGFRWQPTWQQDGFPFLFNDTNWHYVVCTYKRNTQAANVYLDGNTTPTITSTYSAYPNSNSTPFYLCQKWWTQRYTYLSDVIIEDKVWTTQEIANYFNQTKTDYWIS